MIDGDVIRYQCGFAAETPIWRVVQGGKTLSSFRYKKELDEWVSSTGIEDYEAVRDKDVQPVANALSNAKQLIKKIMLRTGADDHTIYLTGKGNFRDEIATILPYKGNRDSSNKPYHYDSLTKYLVENWGAQTVEGIEADDAMATEQYMAYISGDTVDGFYETCIATIDKDLHMIPGWHYNFNKDILHCIDVDTAITWFYCQLIMGDKTVDNIQGIPGAGPKRAEKVLSSCTTEEDMYWAVLDLYQAYYGALGYKPMDALIENARLLWMRREEGIDWNPPA